MIIIVFLFLLLLIFILINTICFKSYAWFSKVIGQKSKFIEFFFIGMFGIEQIIFIIVAFYYKNLSILIISFFAVVVIMTASYQKFLMDIRISKQGMELINLGVKYRALLRKYFRVRRTHFRKL